MNCTNCGTENPEDAQYCAKCGTPMTRPHLPAQEDLAPPPPPYAVPSQQQGTIPPPPPYQGPVPQPQYQQKVENYLIWSIVTTLCCCLPAGIFAIIKSTEVNTKLSNNDYTGAQRAAEAAKTANIAGMVLGLVITIMRIISMVIKGEFSSIMNQ